MESDTPDFEFMIAESTGSMSTAEGDIIHVESIGNIGDEQRREVIAEAYGISPDQVVRNDRTTDRRRRIAVGFHKWRSGWDPHAEKTDPTLN
jgi:hypothetical protein